MRNGWAILGITVSAVATVAFVYRKKIIETAVTMYDKLTRSQFIERFKNAAISSTRGTGLFPSVMMAQAILESGNGNSSLSRLHNNFFGIKADSSWTGEKVNMPTNEVVNGQNVKVDAWFRKYKTAADGFADRNAFLKKFSRYKNAGVFSAATPEAQAAALQKAGYATDPAYADLLVKLINQNNLKALDNA